MAVKISELPSAGSAAGTDQLHLNQGGTSRRATLDQVLAVGHAVPDGSVTQDKIVDGEVIPSKIAGGAGTPASVAAGVATIDFADAAIDLVVVTDGTVTTIKLLNPAASRNVLVLNATGNTVTIVDAASATIRAGVPDRYVVAVGRISGAWSFKVELAARLHAHDAATASVAGFLGPSDKAKLDKLGAATTFAWDPGEIADGESLLKDDIAMSGAEVGDGVVVCPGIDLEGLLVSGYVKDTDTVAVVLANLTGSPVDLDSSTWAVRVIAR